MVTPGISRNISLSSDLGDYIDGLTASGFGDPAAIVHLAIEQMRARGGPAMIAAESLIGGGECGMLIRQRDWAATPLGPIDSWSVALRVTLQNILNSPVAKVLMWGPDHIMLYNDAYRVVACDRHPAALGNPVATAFPEVWDWNRPVLEACFRGETVAYRNQPIVFNRASGPGMPDVAETMTLDLFYTPVYREGVYREDRSVGGVMCTIVDNSEHVAAEQRLAASEAALRRVTDAVPMLISYVDRDHVYRLANAQYDAWLGIDPDTMIDTPVKDVLGDAAYAERRTALDRALAGECFTTQAIFPHVDGRPRRTEVRYVPHIEADGTIPGVYVLCVDVDESAEREAELALSNRRFRSAIDAVHGVLWTNSADGRMLGEQPGWAALTGQTIDQYQNFGWADAIHPEDVAPTIKAWTAAVLAKSMFVFEHRVRRRCGTWGSFAVRSLPILDDAGDVAEWVGVHTDITHQRAAEVALREQADALARQVHHRERAEEQLRQLNETLEARVITEIGERREAEAKLAQSQKMETVGKLTGGVAHDFNNLLQVVSGNLQLLGKNLAGNERAERWVENAMAGVSRGSKLAAQLLAFGRRQALEPKVVNVTRFVRGMDDMLRRAIGEGIEIETVVGGGLWNTFIDPAQIENALLNLAINARDAMEGQGKLTIELGNAHLDDTYALGHEEVEAGQYVMLAVSDTGSGMAPEIIDQVFEPFFSTKSEGKGSGLGLSMVYGFVKQSGGHVKIYSEVGHGTTIKLYLPRAMEREDVEVVTEAGPISGGTETVLVVEDDDEVRATVVELLTDLGYSVLKAVDAASALNVVESGVPIDILFTDVVMPGTLKSPELARKAKERLPDLVVLFTSGYTENSIVHGGKLDAGIDLLSKPYTREALARKFRQVLAQRQRSASASAKAARDLRLEADRRLDASARRVVLLVEDDAMIRTDTAEMLKDSGFVVVDAASAEDAMTALQTVPIDALVTDVNLPGISGPDFARTARTLRPGVGIVFATGDIAAVADQTAAVMLEKPYGLDALAAAVLASLGEAVPTATAARIDEVD